MKPNLTKLLEKKVSSHTIFGEDATELLEMIQNYETMRKIASQVVPLMEVLTHQQNFMESLGKGAVPRHTIRGWGKFYSKKLSKTLATAQAELDEVEKKL